MGSGLYANEEVSTRRQGQWTRSSHKLRQNKKCDFSAALGDGETPAGAAWRSRIGAGNRVDYRDALIGVVVELDKLVCSAVRSSAGATSSKLADKNLSRGRRRLAHVEGDGPTTADAPAVKA